jgi:glutamate-1-semialdehyde 2,1-aminomutase
VNTVDRQRLADLLSRERARYAERHPRSASAFAGAEHLFGRTPMTWMAKQAGGFPLYLATARGARVTDLDGHTFIDLCLGDTGAMAGHSPAAVVEAVQHRLADLGGVTAMLPTEDAAWVGAELARRFGLPRWSLSLTATDANRWAIRLARAITGRQKILVNSYCYHGSVDESLIVVGAGGEPEVREGNVGAPVDTRVTSRVAEYNDLDGLAAELAAGDVAAVLMEPALTNIGIVLPEPGYHDALRAATRRTGTLLIIDETHTICAGPGGYTAAHGLEPDILTIGKPLAAGVPAAAYGFSKAVAEQANEAIEEQLADIGGIGGTLAANVLSLAAMRATLAEVLTEPAFERMIALGERFEAGVREVISRHSLDWHVTRLGCRVEYLFHAEPARTGAQAAAAGDEALDRFIHLYALNRGILLTPFHNMALMCPQTTTDDVARHHEVFAAALGELLA